MENYQEEKSSDGSNFSVELDLDLIVSPEENIEFEDQDFKKGFSNSDSSLQLNSTLPVECHQNYDNFLLNEQNYSIYINKAGRHHQEDRFAVHENFSEPDREAFFGVYDGHGSATVAEYLSKVLHQRLMSHPGIRTRTLEAIEEVFCQLEQEILVQIRSLNKNVGSSALCGLFLDKKLYIINLGDSRAIVIKTNGEHEALSSEHIPSREDERNRIEKLNGFIIPVGNVLRVNGHLNVTRSLGDQMYKPWVSCQPEITVYDIQKEDEYMLLGTDGLWNEISNEEVSKMVIQKESIYGLSRDIFEQIKKKKEYIKDNTTIIAIDLEFYK